MSCKLPALLLLIAALFYTSINAAGQDRTDTSFHPLHNPTLHVEPRDGSITIDGDLSDEGWKHAAHTDMFTCALPIPDTKPKVRTEAFITYDENYLYVAMMGYDDHPEHIRAGLVGRDKIWDDDFMGIILDPYGDATRAFEIYASPKGIQGDLFWTTTNEDDTYDLVYDAESKITAAGWQTELRIPFKSLRFPNRTVQNFHLTFWRNWPREIDYKMSWAPINFTIPCYFCQFGTLTGIENIHPAGKLDLLPALVASQNAQSDLSSPTARLSSSDAIVSPSLGIAYAIGPATDLEAAIKPDFSQVEADQAQVQVNTTFALFYPEHRPFFQDGSDLLSTYINAIYTRSINSPYATIKALHRDENNSIALLSGYDEHTPMILPLEERSVILPDIGKSFATILRATHNFGGSTYLGILATDRRYTLNGSNTVFGLDGRLELWNNIELLGQALVSQTKEQSFDSLAPTFLGTSEFFDHDRHTLELDGEKFWGNSDYAAIQRFTPGLDVKLSYIDYSPAFRAADGFVTTSDYHASEIFTGYKFPQQSPPAWCRWLVEIDGSLSASYQWNYENEAKNVAVRPEVDLSLLGQTMLHIYYRSYQEEFHHERFTGLHQFDVNGNTKPDQRVVLGGEITIGREVAHLLDIPQAGKQIDLNFYARFRPMDALTIEPNYTFSQLASDIGGYFYSGSIYFTRVTYQFTREFNLRTIVQYDGFTRAFDVDPLLAYKLNPFTCFYAGSTHDFTAIDAVSPLQPRERQFFVKVQYLLQTA
jgi:hypothetical protein